MSKTYPFKWLDESKSLIVVNVDFFVKKNVAHYKSVQRFETDAECPKRFGLQMQN